MDKTDHGGNISEVETKSAPSPEGQGTSEEKPAPASVKKEAATPVKKEAASSKQVVENVPKSSAQQTTSTGSPRSKPASNPVKTTTAVTTPKTDATEISLFVDNNDDSFDVRVDDTQVSEIDADLIGTESEKSTEKINVAMDTTGSGEDNVVQQKENRETPAEPKPVEATTETKMDGKEDDKKDDKDSKPAKRLVWFV